MDSSYNEYRKIQKLVLDVAEVERNHHHLGNDVPENVIEHSAAVALLSWRMFDELKPSLDLGKILRYALVHDVLERGQGKDTNAYAPGNEKDMKKIHESTQLGLIREEFKKFGSFVGTIDAYETKADDEARFVWVVDKLQAKILGEMDDWGPHRRYGINYAQFCVMCDKVIENAPDCLKKTARDVIEECKLVYYDNPERKNVAH